MIFMAINDHWLKRAWPSWLTGKLSDFLGVFYFPLLLVAVGCVISNFILRRREVGYIARKNLAVAMAITALLLSLIKISPGAALFVEQVFSRWIFPIRIVADPTDLIALSMLFVTYRFAKRFIENPPIQK